LVTDDPAPEISVEVSSATSAERQVLAATATEMKAE